MFLFILGQMPSQVVKKNSAAYTLPATSSPVMCRPSCLSNEKGLTMFKTGKRDFDESMVAYKKA
jgi:hypothetical protein